MLDRQAEKQIAVGPITVGAEDFAQHAGRRQPGQAGQIDRRFGVARAAQHASFFGHQRKQMPRPQEIARLAGRVVDFQNGPGSLLGGDAGLSRAMIDRHGKRRPQGSRVRIDHGCQLEPLAHLGQDRHAQLPSAVRDHEVDDFGRHLFGRADEISLVFAVLGVDDDHDFAPPDGVNGLVDGGKFLRHDEHLLCEIADSGRTGPRIRPCGTRGPASKQPATGPDHPQNQPPAATRINRKWPGVRPPDGRVPSLALL